MKRDGVVIGLLIAIVLIVLAVVGVLAWEAGSSHERGSTPVTVTRTGGGSTTAASPAVAPTVAAGAYDFVTFACSECHGLQGRGGVSPDVPALRGAAGSLTVGQLSSIIEHGLGESTNPTKPFMPVWGPVISKTQVANLVAYIRAGLPVVPGAEPLPVPTGQGAALAGAVLYLRAGCINCHGPNGLGGVPNPSAPDRVVPPLAGGSFRGEFNTDAKIRDFIRTGSVLGRAPIVSMPHWGGVLSSEQLGALVAYLKTLK